jgi:processive 1,2-diacylglycerol beta-glucosyltransferase
MVLAGMGHIRAAQSIREAFSRISPEIQTDLIDPLEFVNSPFREFFNEFYLWMASHLPRVWGFFYDDKIFFSSNISPFRIWIKNKYAKSIERIFERSSYGLIISTHPFAASGVSVLKKRGILNIPLISVATDFDVHPIGITGQVDLFVVPSEYQKDFLLRKKLPGKIEIAGIPIHPKFSVPKNRDFLRKKFGIKNETTILILSGGFGIGPLEKMVECFLPTKYQLIVVAGKSLELKEKLLFLKKDFGERLHIFGFVDNMDEIMALADLVITKPGGLTTSEALASGLPIVIFRPIPGQESKNVEVLLNSNSAVLVKKLRDIAKVVEQIVSDKVKFRKMKEAVKRLARPNASEQIVRIALKFLN